MKASPLLILALIMTACFTLATGLEPRAAVWSNRAKSDNIFSVLFGDGRRMFANQFFTMADVSFHSGYYPSIFDLRDEGTKAIVSASHGNAESEADEKKEDFLGKPRDWIDRFGRHFQITEHTHLEHSQEREILPWLRLAADTDPQKIETYTVGAYFLCQHLHRPQEGEAFLREGLRNNPGNYEILFSLGRIYFRDYHDIDHARNIWELALNRWFERFKNDSEGARENKLGFEEITMNLADLEREARRYEDAIKWFQAAQKVSPDPTALQKQIDDLKARMAAPTNAPAIPPS
jgi:tetratricopeptide (TPR) repeat protein